MFPNDDLKVPFYSVTEGQSSETYSILISNEETGVLSVSNIQLTGDDASDFTVDLSQPVMDCLAAINTATTCSIHVSFTPQSPGAKVASLTMATNDPDDASVSILLSGIAAPEEANVPARQPQLRFPGNGDHDLGTSLQLKWNQTTDPDGDQVTYHMYVSETPNFATSLEIQTASLSDTSRTTFANSGLGFIAFGVIVIGGFHQRRKIVLVLVLLILIGSLMLSCGSSSDNSSNSGHPIPTVIGLTANALKNNTTYYWKGRADDGKGGITDSETWHFTVSE